MEAGAALSPGSAELTGRCALMGAGAAQPLVCSKEALVHVLETIGWPGLGRLVGLAAVHRAAFGGADDDVRPDPRLLHHGA